MYSTSFAFVELVPANSAAFSRTSWAGYDGGDCCECTCVSAAYTCGDSTHGGYACIDPSAACVDDDDATFLPPTEDFSDTLTTSTRTSSPCVTEFVGDGDCDRINNCEECGELRFWRYIYIFFPAVAVSNALAVSVVLLRVLLASTSCITCVR